MRMDLIPVYEDEEPSRVETGVVEIDPAFVQTIGVQSIPVERTDIPYTIRTMGTVAYNDKQLYFINTKFAGRLENVSVNYIGQPVEKKEVLFEIYSLELVTTQQEYLNALDYAERLGVSDLTDIRERHDHWSKPVAAAFSTGTSRSTRFATWRGAESFAGPSESSHQWTVWWSKRWTRRSRACTPSRA